MVQCSTVAIKKEIERNVWYIYYGSTIKFASRPLFKKNNQICLKLIDFSKFVAYMIISACHTSQFENIRCNVSIYCEEGAFRHPPQSV
jgi:hypothetical protein